MIDFLNWWIQTWPRAIVGVCLFMILAWLWYDTVVLITNMRVKREVTRRRDVRLEDPYKFAQEADFNPIGLGPRDVHRSEVTRPVGRNRT